MNRRLRKRSMAALAGTMIVGGPVLAACAPGNTYAAWAATDGAAGRINLDAVQDAFKKSDSVSEFERLVNEIYEGDGIILIRAKQDGERLTLEGFEDLNKSEEIEDANDDLLFSIVKEKEQNQLRGHGANGYYNRGFGGGDFLFTYLLISSMSRGGYMYQTPRSNVGSLRNQRTTYRGSSAYRSQVSKNTGYFNTQKRFRGSSYDRAGRNIGSNRRTYQSTQRSSGAFRTSGTSVRRSTFGSRSSGMRSSARGGRGGFGGFGGSQTIIGPGRHHSRD